MNGDVSARTAEYAAALLGDAEVAGGVAFPVQVPRGQLDYSLDSLKALQQYLERIRPFANSLDTQVYQNTLLAAGSYLGEVLRREVMLGAEWQTPEGGGMPVLELAGETLSPVAQVQLVLTDTTGEDLPTYAANQFSFTGTAPASEAPFEIDEPSATATGDPAPTATEDDFGFDFLDELDSTPGAETPSEELDLGVEAADVEDLWGDADVTEDAVAPADEAVENELTETSEFTNWDDETNEPADEFGLSASPLPTPEADTDGDSEFAFPWDEPESAVQPSEDADDSFATAEEDFSDVAAEDEFGFSAEPAAADNLGETAEWEAPDDLSADLHSGTTSEWDEDGEIVLDVEIVEEDEDDESEWPATPAGAAVPMMAEPETDEDDGEIDLWSGGETTEATETAPADEWMDFDAAEPTLAELEPMEEVSAAEEPSAPLPFTASIVPPTEADPFDFESASNDEQELPSVESETQELAEFGEGQEFGFDFESESAGEDEAREMTAEEAARTEDTLADDLLGELTAEEMADDESLLGFGKADATTEMPAESADELGEEFSSFDPLVEPAETTQDWDPVAEEPIAEEPMEEEPATEEPMAEPAAGDDPWAESATPAVQPAAPEKAPDSWDFSDFFAEAGTPAIPTPPAADSWYQEFESAPTSESPEQRIEASEDSLVADAEPVAADDAFDFESLLASPAAEPVSGELADTPDLAEESSAGEAELAPKFSTEFTDESVGELDELLNFGQTDDAAELLGLPNEDSTVIEEGTSEFAALFGGELEGVPEAGVEPTLEASVESTQPEDDMFAEASPVENSGEAEPIAEAELTEAEPAEGATSVEDWFFGEGEASGETSVEQAETELTAEVEPANPAAASEWDFANVAEEASEAAQAFDFDLTADDAVPVEEEPAADMMPEVEVEPAVAEEDNAVEKPNPVEEYIAAEEGVATGEEVAAGEDVEEDAADELAEFAEPEMMPFEEAAAEAEEFTFDFDSAEPTAAEEPAAEEPADIEAAADEGAADEFDFGFESVGAESETEFSPFDEVDPERVTEAPVDDELNADELAAEELAEAPIEPKHERPHDSFEFDFTGSEAVASEPASDEALSFDFAAESADTAEPVAEETPADEFSFELEEPSAASSEAQESVDEVGEKLEAASPASITESTSDDEGEWDFAAVEENFAAEELFDDALAEPVFATEDEVADPLPTDAFATADEIVEEEPPLPPALAAQQARIDEYLPAATSGDAVAQFELGCLYEEGLFAEDHFPEAVRRYQEAADQHHPAAMARLGHLYYLGQGIGQNWKKGVQLYLQAAKSGEPLAQCNLGMCLEHGKGVQRDMEKALRCYYAGANAGSAPCQTNLALCYLRGRGVKQHLRVGARWLAKAVEQNYGPALLLLGACYEGGVGVEKSSAEAESLYRRAADAGFAFPKKSWTIRTKHGQAGAADAVDPIWWLRLAADAEEPWAQHNMGLCYRAGHGVRESASKTLQWFQLASKANFAPAQYELGRCFELATGTPKDMARAAKWYTRAATAGYAPAQARLALLYDCGLGVERDPVLAAKWGEK